MEGPPEARLARLVERLRWLPHAPQGKFLVVNVPAFRLAGFEAATDDRPAMQMRVVVGRPPARELFARPRRDFSHGCIRLENAAALAEFLLARQGGWTRERIEQAMDGEGTVRVDLPSPVPDFIYYTTAIVRHDGTVEFFDDIYGKDDALDRVPARRTVARLTSAWSAKGALPAARCGKCCGRTRPDERVAATCPRHASCFRSSWARSPANQVDAQRRWRRRMMPMNASRWAVVAVVALAAFAGPVPAARTDENPRLRMTAFAVDLARPRARTGTIEIVIERWSTDEERDRLRDTLVEKGSDALLAALTAIKPRAGYIRGSTSLGWDIHFARDLPLEKGGRRIIIATDRPMSFWEIWQRPRSADYEYTLAEIRLTPDGKGEGKLVAAAKVTWNEAARTVEVENYAFEPVRLTEVRVEGGK